MTAQQVIAEVEHKYSEWLEMAGEKAPVILNSILATLLVKEREKIEYYEKRLRNFEREGVIR